MSAEELDVFLAEMEPDVRAADRDIREIEMLEKKGVTAAGKLPGLSEHLQPLLQYLKKACRLRSTTTSFRSPRESS
jgi:hypothetical protein